MMSRQGDDSSFVEFPQGFQARVFDRNHQVTSEISADYGVNHTDQGIVEARGNVSVENQQNGQSMYSDKLYWYQDTKMIYTRSKVRIVTPDKDIIGDSLEAYENFEAYTIYNGKATFELEED
jgi:LPS export ABC transporter protein LptC